MFPLLGASLASQIGCGSAAQENANEGNAALQADQLASHFLDVNGFCRTEKAT